MWENAPQDRYLGYFPLSDGRRAPWSAGKNLCVRASERCVERPEPLWGPGVEFFASPERGIRNGQSFDVFEAPVIFVLDTENRRLDHRLDSLDHHPRNHRHAHILRMKSVDFRAQMAGLNG